MEKERAETWRRAEQRKDWNIQPQGVTDEEAGLLEETLERDPPCRHFCC